jgi:hypothetical protein
VGGFSAPREVHVGDNLSRVPEEIQGHIRQITKSSGLPDTEDSVELIAEGWLEKKERFEKVLAGMSMEEVAILEKSDERGCLVMTYSGSLLNIGPLRGQGRVVQYASIGLRQDVPEAATREGSELGADVRIGAPVSFSTGPIQSSSPVLKIAVTGEDIDLSEQERQITKATQVLTKEFVKVNKDLEG